MGGMSSSASIHVYQCERGAIDPASVKLVLGPPPSKPKMECNWCGAPLKASACACDYCKREQPPVFGAVRGDK